MTGRALFAIGSDDRDVTNFPCRADETFQPVREDSVIVGTKDSHLRAVLGRLLLYRDGLRPVEHRQQFADLSFDVGQRLGAERGTGF